MLPLAMLRELAPYGYSTQVLEVKTGETSYGVSLQLSKIGRESIRLTLPLPRPEGPFVAVGGVERTFVPVVTPTGTRSRLEVARDLLMRALEMALADHVNRGSPPPDGDVVMACFRRLLAASPLVLDTPEGEMERQGVSDMVRIETVGNGPHDLPREFPEEQWGKLDPNSTSQGGKINEVYRRANGNPWSLCETLRKNAIGLRHLTSRVFLLRTAFERHLPQVIREEPLVANVGNELSGKNLLTVFMDLGVRTFEDAIAVSESAAVAMTAVRRVKNSFTTREPVRLLVGEGDPVDPGAPLAHLETSGKTIRARRLAWPGTVARIQIHRTAFFGLPAARHVVTMETRIPIHTGDKIAGRHGNKGIAEVLPDDGMPLVQCPWDPARWLRADVCLSPFSVLKRRMMSLYWEGMAARKAIASGTTFQVGPFEDPPGLGFEELVREGHGSKVPVRLGGGLLPYPSFAAPLYWLRLDRLAAEDGSAAGDDLAMDHQDLSLDSTRNGQRRDIAKSAAMFHRGLKKLLGSGALRSTKDVAQFVELARALEPDFEFEHLAGRKPANA